MSTYNLTIRDGRGNEITSKGVVEANLPMVRTMLHRDAVSSGWQPPLYFTTTRLKVK